MPRRIAIVVPVLRPRDAVGTDAIEMARVLIERGHDARLFAESAVGVDVRVAPTSRVGAFVRDRNDLLVYHFSFGWPGAVAMLRESSATRIVKYHNVTPPEFFAPYSQDFVHACAAGRAQIQALVDLRCELYLADSPFNLGELTGAGLPPERGRVLPPFARIEQLVACKADLALLDEYRGAGSNLLMVGRLAPNKGHVELVEAFGRYVADFEPGARLIVVGKHDSRLRGYVRAVRNRIDALGLAHRVAFIQDASETVLKAAYLVADALVLLSRHEGFCVPLVEAMALGVPIVAHAAAAVPDTIGDAGLVFADREPLTYACAIDALGRDASAKRALTASARRRYERRYSTPSVERGLLDALGLPA